MGTELTVYDAVNWTNLAEIITPLIYLKDAFWSPSGTEIFYVGKKEKKHPRVASVALA